MGCFTFPLTLLTKLKSFRMKIKTSFYVENYLRIVIKLSDGKKDKLASRCEGVQNSVSDEANQRASLVGRQVYWRGKFTSKSAVKSKSELGEEEN